MRRLSWLVPLLYVLFVLVPIYWLLNMSFKSTNEILGSFTLFPREFTLANYRKIFTDATWYGGYLNSLRYVLLNTVASVVVGGTLLTGGSGSVATTLAGVLLLGILFNVLNFENGKLTSMTGEGDGFPALKAAYDAANEGKDILSYVDFGINPNYTLPGTTKYGNWVSSGMVSLGSGNNTWAGGTNNSAGGAGGHLAGCTVTIDGKTIMDKGELKL